MMRILTTLLLLLCLCTCGAALPPRYRVTDIGPDMDQNPFINNSGQIAGSYSTGQFAYAGDHSLRGFLWMQGKRIDLGLPRGYSSTIVCGINNRGQIAGNLDDTTDGATLVTVSHAFLWQHGGMQDLGAPSGDKVSEARAINDKGEVVGRAYASGRPVEDDASLTEHHAFVYENGQMTDLGVGEADAINDKDQIVGETPVGVDFDAMLWDRKKVIKLGVHGQAVAINNKELIVIQMSTAQSILWQKGHSVNLLPPPGYNQAQAAAINNQGRVVGTTTDGQNSRATLWHDGRAFDLNDCISAHSGWVLTSASGINDKGQIVGHGFFHGKDHVFLLTPATSR